MTMRRLKDKVTALSQVGSVLEKKLALLQIHTIQDLLFHFPFRYEDYRSITKIDDATPGTDLTIQGTIELIANKRSPRKRTMITEAVVSDESGQMRVIWFGQQYLGRVLKVGDKVSLSGTVKEDMFGLHMSGPLYEKIRTDKSSTHTARIVPMYPLTKGITHKQIRFLIEQALPIADTLDEWIPEAILHTHQFVSLSQAIRMIHFPDSHESRGMAERRLKFGELFVLQLRAELIRRSTLRSEAPVITFLESDIKSLVASLPFTLTIDQKKSAWEIFQDMGKSHPMNRMLQGDVGSGKTVVGGMSAYLAARNGYQTVVMAPTEILARQHYETFGTLFASHLRICLFTRTDVVCEGLEKGNMSRRAYRTAIIEMIRNHEIDVIIGTHALLVDEVQFVRLGLTIVDEQHRFGVAQRKTIRDKSGMAGIYPHFLSMTATPIPRSYALTLYGDLDVSYIKTKPQGRKSIMTRVVDPHHRERAYQFIRDEVKKGRQVFVICPLIQEKDTHSASQDNFVINPTVEKKTVVSEYEKLSTTIFPELTVGYIHGKLKSVEKETTMSAFASGKIDILVSTSLVEVGVDIPNASIMMIEGSDRFGLAQLHQFRGRVGRGVHQSYCLLFADDPSPRAIERMTYFASTDDGFALAEYDLETRGPGEVYGTAQSGLSTLRLATMRDHELIRLARECARDIDFAQFPSLKDKVVEWEDTVHLE